MNRMITPFVLTFSLLVLLPSLTTSAQPTDPSLLLPGAAVDSITGGRPSVMIRRTNSTDQLSGKRHELEFDPILGLLYSSFSYHFAPIPHLHVGGRVQFMPGYIGKEEVVTHSLTGGGVLLQLFPSPRREGVFFHIALDYAEGSYSWDEGDSYSGYYYGDSDFTYLGASLDLGYRRMLASFYIDFRLGLSKPLDEIDMPAGLSEEERVIVQDQVIGILGRPGDTDLFPHGGAALGIRF